MDWDESVLLFYSHSSTDHAVTKLTFGEIFIETLHKAAVPANIKAGVKALHTGKLSSTPWP